jgi:uncharacterized protein YfkK (UPF0435 family)
MSGVGFSCTWCGRILLDRPHAIQHGPVCEKNPIVPEVQRRTRYATLGEIHDVVMQRARFATPEAFRELQALARHVAEMAGDLPASGDLKADSGRATLPE